MEHGGDSDLRLEASPAKLQQRLAGGGKEQLEERATVLPDKSVEAVGQGEDQVEVRDGQERGLLLFEPIDGQSALALRAMAVATTVRHEVLALAVLAMKELSAQRARPAGGQGTHRFPLLRRQA
jgi:hypothetical protein